MFIYFEKKKNKMISAFVLSLVVSFACASISPIVIIPSTATTTLLRTPQHDSAVVQSERLGGSFTYAVAEGQAFRAVPPVISSVSVLLPLFERI